LYPSPGRFGVTFQREGSEASEGRGVTHVFIQQSSKSISAVTPPKVKGVMENFLQLKGQIPR